MQLQRSLQFRHLIFRVEGVQVLRQAFRAVAGDEGIVVVGRLGLAALGSHKDDLVHHTAVLVAHPRQVIRSDHLAFVAAGGTGESDDHKGLNV